MRDPKRIEKILQKLGKIWKKNPDLRLTQLILNLKKHNDTDLAALFYMEDEELIKRLDNEYLRSE